ncbi:MAG: hypothetical protein JO233_03465, partial [Candidatus Eremiobacteraeota bacterium]|nr:hypothetical protein [Candidatus Eremiobacteraeota bacterium]
LHYNIEIYQTDGGRAGTYQEASLQYYSNRQDRPRALRVALGLMALPLPFQPETFRPTNQHYAVWDQTVGGNPFAFFDPKNQLQLGLGRETRGTSVTLAAVQGREKHSFVPERGLDTMLALKHVAGPLVFNAFTYSGVRALPGGDDRFTRSGFALNLYTGRLSFENFLQQGFNTNANGDGAGIHSSGGFSQLRYGFPNRTELLARYDGVAATDGTFGRAFIFGAARRFGRGFRVEAEDVLSTSPTHNALGIVFDFSLTNGSGASY